MGSSDKELLACFKMPGGSVITGRTTSIKNVFVAAIIPIVRPSADEVRQVLEIFELEANDLRCSYCGDRATEWDHLRPLVKEGKPTGYPSSIRNLVPSCGKCNQSKGSSDWKEWMLGVARHSPSVRKIADVEQRIARLERFEVWASCVPLDVRSLVSSKLWDQYYAMQEEILSKMRDAQKLAIEIAGEIKSKTSSHRL
ncbi:MAG TPA: HNH endonuclease [Terriglobales bacterium]|jgi:5-methylcytosine-specific restriction endonuclease McrA|nr:HNH endonuclease [Terriglobales bacterium]